MELVVRKNDLLRELQLFQGIVERKNTIPILANVLMEAKDDEIKLLATDLEVGLRSRCHASVSKGGTLTLPAKKLYEIVKALPETDVRIEEDKNGVKVAADQFDSRMQTQPPQDFPAVPESGGAASATLSAASIRAILPRKTLWELGKLLAESNGEVQYERGENHLFFQVGDRMLISRMIDGQFPAFERVIPKGNNRQIEFERERLTSAVRRVALLSNERSKAVKFAIDNGKVEVTSSSPEFGEAHELIPVDYNGGAMQICFNAQYVIDFLNVVETDNVMLEVKDEMSQAVMKPIGAEGYDYTYVIMPMRV